MGFHLLIRRVHLYLAMFLRPWFFVYGTSSGVFSHSEYLNRLHQDGVPQWTQRFERPYDLPVAPDADLREVGARILQDQGMKAEVFGAFRSGAQQLEVHQFSFRSTTRLRYLLDRKRIVAEDRRFRWDQFLTGIHGRGGFDMPSRISDAWGVLVDLVCGAILIWIATGVYMWGQLPQCRRWGWLALAGGAGAFAIFVAGL